MPAVKLLPVTEGPDMTDVACLVVGPLTKKKEFYLIFYFINIYLKNLPRHST